MDKYYHMPINDRVRPFLLENTHMWHTARSIAGHTHLVEWQVTEQLAPLIANDEIAVEAETWATLYRLKAISGTANGTAQVTTGDTPQQDAGEQR